MKRSFMSAFAAFVIRASGTKRKYADPVKREKYVEGLKRKNSKPFRLPPYFYRSKPEKQLIDGVETIIFGAGSGDRIIYLHGGAYCEPPLLPHFMFCDNIASKSGYEVIFPIYKKSPEHTFEETFAFLEKLYRRTLAEARTKRVVFMGDSSGGGLALAFSEHIRELSLPQPERLILLSPWVDVSMDTPFDPEIDRLDPNLQLDFLRLAGKNWAGTADVHDPRVSPVYGDLSGLAPMTVYYGTHENIIFDARIFKGKCENAGAQLEWHEYEGMNHVFVVYPIPEAKKAQREIVETLRSIGSRR